MDKEIKKILKEIVFLLVMCIIIIPIFIISSSDTVNAREKMSGYSSKLKMTEVSKSNTKSLSPMSDEEAIEEIENNIIKISNCTDNNVEYKFIFKISKIEDYYNYKIMINGSIYNLKDIEYTKDDNYMYFIIKNYKIRSKDQYVSFMFWLSDEGYNYTSENFNYSYMIEEV